MVLSKTYNATLEDFKTYMTRFLGKYGQKLKFNNVILDIQQAGSLGGITQAVWPIKKSIENKSVENEIDFANRLVEIFSNATLLATQQANGQLTVDFIDGKKYGRPAMPISKTILDTQKRLFETQPEIDDDTSPKWYGGAPIGEPLQRLAELIFGEFESTIQPTETPLAPLQKPPKEANLSEWFDYYHECKKRRIKYTLKDIASDAGYAHSYVRRKHSEYSSDSG